MVRIAAVLISLSGLIIGLGFGCGMGFQPMGAPTQNGFNEFGSQGNSQPDLVVVAESKTIGVTNYSSVLDNMTSMTNVAPSANTRNLFNQQIANFSETKSVLNINAPMLMGYVTIGAEVCNDLINAEQALPAASRRFFTGANLNFAANTNNNNAATINNAVIDDWVRRFARQFWQRNETPAELELLRAGVAEMRVATPVANNGLSRRIALYVCTAAIASTSAYEI